MTDRVSCCHGRYQDAAAAIFDEFQSHDEHRLTALTPRQRDEQLRARRQMYRYLSDIWDDAKRSGIDPLDESGFDAPAALRDLFGGLVVTATAVDREQ